MKEPPRFPCDEGDYVCVPESFFSDLLPEIDDINELKVTLAVFGIIGQKRVHRFVTLEELRENGAVMSCIDGEDSPVEALHRILETGVGRGTLLRLTLDENGEQRELYFLNTEADREVRDRMHRRELSPGETEVEEKPNIFVMYEQNIGVLTPMIVEELKEAEEAYPSSWIEDAFREAVSLNKRSWRYISRILERWSSEGRYHGEPGRHSEKKPDTDKYIRGKYGHVVKRRITW